MLSFSAQTEIIRLNRRNLQRYVVTDRMLEMFKSDKGKKKEEEAK